MRNHTVFPSSQKIRTPSICRHDDLPEGCVGVLGEPDCACYEVPTSEGVAFYDQGSRYCVEGSVCRPVENRPGIWRCRDCQAPESDGLGCPCLFEDQCKPGLVCLGEVAEGADPHQYPFPSQGMGACWELGKPLDGFCDENCLAQGRVCDTTLMVQGAEDLGFPVQACVIPECADVLTGEACEFEPDLVVCDRDASPSECVQACDADFGQGGGWPCPAQAPLCTTWGECL